MCDQAEQTMQVTRSIRNLRSQLATAKTREALALVRDNAEGLAILYPAAAPEFREVAKLATKREKKKRAAEPIGPRPPKPSDLRLRKGYEQFCAAGGRSIEEYAKDVAYLDPEEVSRAFDRLRKAQRKSSA